MSTTKALAKIEPVGPAQGPRGSRGTKRGPSRFREVELARAYRAAQKAADGKPFTVSVDPATGKIDAVFGKCDGEKPLDAADVL